MQSLGMIVTAGLGVLVIAEGAYIVRTRSQMADLAAKVEALSVASYQSDGPGFPRPAPANPADRDGDEGDAPRLAAQVAKRPPVPRFINEPAVAPSESSDPLPLPAAVSSPEAREQLRQFVVAQLARERQEARLRDEQRMMARVRELRAAAVKPLGLSSTDTAKFMEITDRADAARVALRTRLESGDVDRSNMRQEMMALREQSERELKTLLGEDRMKQYEQIRREQGPAEGGGGPFMRGFGGGGRGRGGDVAAGAGAPAGAAPASTSPVPQAP